MCQQPGLKSFGARLSDRAPPVCRYSLRATSTTLRIKVAKANKAPSNKHKSANDIVLSFRFDGEIAVPHKITLKDETYKYPNLRCELKTFFLNFLTTTNILEDLQYDLR